ncbi:MAG: hypothetical protein A2289_11530 [Deltaproteobacteria bacterium RIFOXYA12_FULL_58_15]|nr:MAG: hypothetical protein A2289_11530 [Deltaproteobacteria bacterium RIFOXYA12_FULL_58_15]
MWLAYRDTLAQLLATVWFGLQPAPVAATPKSPAAKDTPAPLEFRCDGMQVLTKPSNRSLCRHNVVIRRGDLLLCCQNFEGIANADWEWQTFTCTENVRATRGTETMWADKATFVLETSELFLTGTPLLRRGKSLLSGTRIVVEVTNDRARLDNPRGVINTNKEVLPPPAPTTGTLPDTCPLPPRPRS